MKKRINRSELENESGLPTDQCFPEKSKAGGLLPVSFKLDALTGLILLFFFITMLFIASSANAQTEQDTTKTYRIETTDGNEFIGKIKELNAEKIILITDRLGEITIWRQDIKSIEEVQPGSIVQGAHWFPNPQASRYFWMPNGYGLRKGESYYQNVWVLFNQVSVGFSENFSVGFGMIPLFLFGADGTPVWITPKFSIPVKKDKFNVGAGVLFSKVLGLGEGEGGFGIAYGITTFGTRDKNTSIGLGYGFSDGEWANSPTVSVSFMARTSAKGYFISENYFIGTGESTLVLISLGGRRIIRKVGLDFGLFMPFTEDLDRFIGIPWLGLTVPFAKKG